MLFRKLQLKNAPLRLEQLGPLEQLGYILGDQEAADTIAGYLRQHPDAWKMEPNHLAVVLSFLDGVGPGRATQYVLLELWAAERYKGQLAA